MSDIIPRRRIAAHVVLPVVTAALAAGGIVAATGSSAAPGPARLTAAQLSAMPTQVLHGDTLPQLGKATRLRRTPAGTNVLVGVVLADRHAAAEERLLHSLYTKGSGDYHHFLTPAEYQARFAAPATAYRRVEQWATRDGLKVAHTTAMHDYLSLTGTAAQAERTFAVRLNDYRQAGARFFANAQAPTIPAGYGITGVIGLNSKLHMSLPATSPAKSRTALTSGAAPSGIAPAAVHPAQDSCAGTVCTGLTTPQDLWSAYDLPADNYGEGQSMAIFGEGQVQPVVSNLRTFESVHKLPQVPVSVVRTDGKADYSDNSGEVEWDLDTQASTGMSPNVLSEKLYFGKDLSDSSVAGVFDAWANDPNGPLQASASYGECEENPVGNGSASGGYAFSAGTEFTLASEAALRQAVAEGRTLFSSTGDTGSSCPVVPVDVNGVGNEGFPVVNYPASSPEVVAVGGTVLYTDGTGADQTGETPSGATRVNEYSWNYTGGGTSVTFPQPDYQKKYSAPQPTADCVATPDGGQAASGTVCRAIPDIAAQSGDVASNGYAIVSQGQTSYPGGGTSLSSPLSLGMWTRIQAAAPAKVVNGVTTYPGNGFANETYYADYAKHASDFYDIGNPGASPPSQPNSNGAYASAPGDDYLSGLGMPDVKAIATHVDGGTAPTHDVLPSYPATSSPYRYCTTPEPPLFTDAAGDDAFIGDPAGSGSNPQLDILSGDMTTDSASNPTTLTTTLTIKNLTKNQAQAAGAGNDYYFVWTYKGTQYYTSAQVDTTTGAVTYSSGTISGNQYQDTSNSKATGSFNTGAPGTVVVTVPLSEVGSPPAGADLQAPAGQTKVLVGSSATGGLIEQADVGGPQYDYAVGQVCDPNATSPTPVPATTTSNSYNFSGSATASASATPSSISPSISPTTSTGSPKPTSSSPKPTSSSPKPTKSSPAPNPKPKRDHRKPFFTVSRWIRSHHRITRVVRFGDTGSGVVRIVQVRLVHARWSYGKAHTHRFGSPRHRGRFRVWSRSRHAMAYLTLVDKAGNKRRIHFRL